MGRSQIRPPGVSLDKLSRSPLFVLLLVGTIRDTGVLLITENTCTVKFMTIKYFVNIARKLEDKIWNSVEKESFVFSILGTLNLLKYKLFKFLFPRTFFSQMNQTVVGAVTMLKRLIRRSFGDDSALFPIIESFNSSSCVWVTALAKTKTAEKSLKKPWAFHLQVHTSLWCSDDASSDSTVALTPALIGS